MTYNQQHKRQSAESFAGQVATWDGGRVVVISCSDSAIAPLVAVFVLASKTTDAFQMAQWSSRNVIPAKIALGIVFALLAVLTVFVVLLPAR